MKKILRPLSLLLTCFNLAMFFAMRPCWSGISKTFGYTNGGSEFILNFPVYFCVLLLVIFLANLAFFALKREGKAWPWVFGIIGLIFLVAIIVIIELGAKDYMYFIWPNFFKVLAALLGILILAFFVFCYPKTTLPGSKLFKGIVLGAALLIAGLVLTKFNINYISYEPVVYAVEDEYQIVFSTNAKALGWVEINGKEYYDLHAGSQKSADKVHKICVPMEDLNAAGGYKIHTQRAIYRGPFGGLLGKDIQKSYPFYPVNSTDGLTYLNLSDVHMRFEPAKKLAKAAGQYDFLLIGGDTISMVDSFRDANFMNKLAFELTGGAIPVIYARGNHEVKGAYAEQLYKYVGSKNEKYHYSVELGDAYILVLDIGEDHDDDWWEYYGTAEYQLYCEEQMRFMETELQAGTYANYRYRISVCHIPPVYVNYRHNQEDIKAKFTELLNRMELDLCLCGHQHELLIFEPGLVPPNTKLVYNPKYQDGTYNGYLTDFNFPNLMIGGHSLEQKDVDEPGALTGLIVSANMSTGVQTCWYLNSEGQKVSVVNPFADKDYGTEIVIDKVKGTME